jgi:hypothetical protein
MKLVATSKLVGKSVSSEEMQCLFSWTAVVMHSQQRLIPTHYVTIFSSLKVLMFKKVPNSELLQLNPLTQEAWSS